MPRALRASTSPSRASRTAGSSAAGSAWAMLPPIVPRLRIAPWPMKRTASASNGLAVRTTSLRSTVRWRTIAPTVRPLPFSIVARSATTVDVDEVRRPGEAQAQQRNQALPTGQHLGLVGVFREQRNHLIDRSGPVILEPRWLHGAALSQRAARSGPCSSGCRKVVPDVCSTAPRPASAPGRRRQRWRPWLLTSDWARSRSNPSPPVTGRTVLGATPSAMNMGDEGDGPASWPASSSTRRRGSTSLSTTFRPAGPRTRRGRTRESPPATTPCSASSTRTHRRGAGRALQPADAVLPGRGASVATVGLARLPAIR